MIKDTIISISKKLFNVDNNFLPHGTVINVKLDGSGDFTNLQDAINYLTGKYSGGEVKIKLGPGTFTTTIPYYVNTNKFNFSKLIIEGSGVDTTFLNRTDYTSMYIGTIEIKNLGTIVEIKDLTINSVNDTSSSHSIDIKFGAKGIIHNIKLNTAQAGVYAFSGSYVYIIDIEILNCGIAICAHEGDIVFATESYLTVTNSYVALNAIEGGTIRTRLLRKTYSNVTNQTNKTIGTINFDGFIIGN